MEEKKTTTFHLHVKCNFVCHVLLTDGKFRKPFLIYCWIHPEATNCLTCGNKRTSSTEQCSTHGVAQTLVLYSCFSPQAFKINKPFSPWLERTPACKGWWSWNKLDDWKPEWSKNTQVARTRDKFFYFWDTASNHLLLEVSEGGNLSCIPRNCHTFSSWSVMMVAGWVVNTTRSRQSPPGCLSLLLLLQVVSTQGQIHPHYVPGDDLGREQSCCQPALQREITWSAGI